MFCFRCGASMPDDAQVCPQCSTPVEQAPVPPPAPPAPPPSAWLNPSVAQPQYPQGQYYPGQPGFEPQQQTDGKAIASLVLGIASYVFCLWFLTGIPAVILGHLSRSSIRQSMGRLKGDGMALAGIIMGYASLAGILVFAAVIIPSFNRGRTVANEVTATSTMRSINTAQVAYITNYPERGYAPDLATLGPGQSGSCNGSGTAEHACLIDSTLGHYTCTSGFWCIKGAYKYTVVADDTCAESPSPGQERPQHCNYVAIATPLDSTKGHRSYCSVSDAVIRQQFRPVEQPITAEECSSWSPVT